MSWCFSADIGQFCKNYFIFEKPLKKDTSFSWLNVSTHPKRRHVRQQTNGKTKDIMPALRKIKRAATQRKSRNKLQNILFCPTAPKPTHHPKHFTKKFGMTEYKFLFLSKSSRLKNQDNGSKLWRIY